MIGTFCNTFAILIGSLIGGNIKKGLDEKKQLCLFDAMGLSAVLLGLHSAIKNLSNSQFPVLFILSLAIGSLIGNYLDLDYRFSQLINKYSKNNLSEGLATAIVMFCIGTLSILGPIYSALKHDQTFLFTNATLDFVTSIVLASTYGLGIAFASIVLFIWQGSIYLLANQLSVLLTNHLLTEISIIGGILIFASGLSILKIKTFKTFNLLPALLVPIIWFIIRSLY